MLLRRTRRLRKSTPTSPRRLPLERLEERCMLAVGVLDTPAQTVELFDISPAVFIENRGQWADDSIRYALLGNGANVLHTDTGPVFQLVGGVSDGDYVGGVSERRFSGRVVHGCHGQLACPCWITCRIGQGRASRPWHPVSIVDRIVVGDAAVVFTDAIAVGDASYKHHVLDAIRGGGDDYAGRF
ncbi:MAG: hypothetical protein IID44_27305 [Planctomycetes bacterium]|nr:hypothetical protein [Planctomycetota bacterium]